METRENSEFCRWRFTFFQVFCILNAIEQHLNEAWTFSKIGHSMSWLLLVWKCWKSHRKKSQIWWLIVILGFKLPFMVMPVMPFIFRHILLFLLPTLLNCSAAYSKSFWAMALAVPVVNAPAVPVATWHNYSSSRSGGRSGRSGRFWASCALSLAWRCRPCRPRRPRRPRPWRRAVPQSPVELASDFDAEDPELRVEAAHSVGAFSLTSSRWPPQKLLTNTEELSPIKAETTVGRYTGSAPTFAKWPIYETKISEIGILEDAEELKTYKIVDFEKGLLTRAFVLASRWQKANLGRSAGFERQGIGILSGFKFTNPILMRQLQGLNVLQGYLAEKFPGGWPKLLAQPHTIAYTTPTLVGTNHQAHPLPSHSSTSNIWLENVKHIYPMIIL